MKQTLLLLLLAAAACNPYKALRSDQFAYLSAQGNNGVALRVPKGYSERQDAADSLGRQVRLYRYRDGSFFYVAYAPQGGDIQPIDRDDHVPQLSPVGDTLYKQQVRNRRWWREDKKGLLRAGYILVPEGDKVALFDSAVNFVRRVR